MNILAIETSSGAHSVALLSPGGRWERAEDRESARAETLLLLVRDVMAEARLTFDALDRIACCTGPGSFTGIRTGLAAARGIGLAAGKPVVGATSLEIIAAELVAAREAGGRFAVALDARKEELYVQVFGADGSSEGPPLLLARAEVATLGELRWVGGPAAPILAAWLGPAADVTVIGSDVRPGAARLAWMARDLVPGAPPAPVYLRAADAKPPSPDTVIGRRP